MYIYIYLSTLCVYIIIYIHMYCHEIHLCRMLHGIILRQVLRCLTAAAPKAGKLLDAVAGDLEPALEVVLEVSRYMPGISGMFDCV